MATAKMTVDVRVLGAGFVAKVMRRGMTTALDEVGRRIKRDHDKMNAAYGTDYDAAVEDCLGVVAAVRTDAESAPLPENEAPAAPQWLDAPTCDGPWWRYAAGDGRPELVEVKGHSEPAEGRQMRVYSFGVEWADWLPMPTAGTPRTVGDYRWLRVDVPEAPR